MKFRRKTFEIDAVQWQTMGDHPAVTRRGPFILFSRDKCYFYVDHSDRLCAQPSFWLAVNPAEAVSLGREVYLDFIMYEVKSGERVPAEDHPELLEAYAKASNWGTRRPRVTGLIEEGRKNQLVDPGDWIVTHEDQTIEVMKPGRFEAEFEPSVVG